MATAASDWTDGYRAALRDLERLSESRFEQSFPTRFREAVARLLADLRRDMDVIDHEHFNTAQRAELDAERQAAPKPQGSLFEAAE